MTVISRYDVSGLVEAQYQQGSRGRGVKKPAGNYQQARDG